ncbi:MAG TPA: deoxyribose-phosphate aldolase, partial [Kaistia sp.]|nr:deoxyribose-phosphate aldolase [Kaistia sp.]
MPADGSTERKTPPLSNALKRNDGTPLQVEWFDGAQVNTSAAERRAATLPTRRTVKKEYQAAWLVKAVTLMDLTTLAGDDTPGRVHRLCMKARR